MKTSLFAAVLLFFTIPIQVSARADESVPQNDDAEKAERIEVTGSHIKRIDVEGVAPVETVTHVELEKKGYNNLGDVVRDLGVSSFGSSTVSGNSTAPGNAEINLRGLGGDNTLVLLNGQRLPQDAITGTVDINLIPMAAVDRIEILKDGASAVYGSDALGGVVNIITKKDFQGTEFDATQSLSTDYTGGKQTRLSVVNGINGEKLNIVTAINYIYNQAINSKDRFWSNAPTNLSTIGYPGSYSSSDPANGDVKWFPSPSCPAGSLSNTTAQGQFCQFKYSDFSEESPLVTQIGGLSEAHYELNSNIRFNARIGYDYRDAQTIAAPSPGTATIPATAVAQFNLPTGTTTPGDPLDVRVRLVPLGTRNTDVTTNAYSALFGSTIQMPHDWQMDINTTYNLVNTTLTGTSGFALASVVANLIQSGAFNPFVNNATPGSLASAAYVPSEVSQSLLTGIEIKASGDLFQGWAGPVGMAVGTTLNFASYSDTTDAQTLAGNVFGNAGSSGAGHRTSEAVYTEFSVPIVQKKLEAQLAARFDNYSDFGNTTNPKFGMLYHAMPTLLFRGSVGTGFRAPLLSELYAGQTVGFPAFIDHVACKTDPTSCTAQQWGPVTNGGNPNLKQETSVSYSLGTVFEPLPVLNFGADFFYTKISNVPGIDLNDMTQAQANGVNPANSGVIVTRDSNGYITKVFAPLQNLSQTNEAGIDLTGAYTYKMFKIQTEQNQLFFYNTEGFPGAGLVNKLGWNGLPTWRNTTTLTFVPADAHVFSLTARSIPHQLTSDQTGFISPITTFDFSYVYKTKVYGDFSVGVINILGSSPPLDPSTPTAPVNYSLYDPNGRQVVFGYKKAL